MSQDQTDIDALLAEVSTLAETAVADVVGTKPDSGRASEPSAPPPSHPKILTSTPTTIRTADTPPPPPDVTRVLNLEVPVIVSLAERTMPLSEIVAISTGAIIEFDKPADSELELLINNKCIGAGQAVKVGENFGLRVSRVGTLQDRIKAMGKS